VKSRVIGQPHTCFRGRHACRGDVPGAANQEGLDANRPGHRRELLASSRLPHRAWQHWIRSARSAPGSGAAARDAAGGDASVAPQTAPRKPSRAMSTAETELRGDDGGRGASVMSDPSIDSRSGRAPTEANAGRGEPELARAVISVAAAARPMSGRKVCVMARCSPATSAGGSAGSRQQSSSNVMDVAPSRHTYVRVENLTAAPPRNM
jgi:hypothetical protein